MEEQIKLIIPSEYLPENWKATTATLFNISISTVEKVANGNRKNTLVFDHLLSLAEEGKRIESLRIERLDKLNN